MNATYAKLAAAHAAERELCEQCMGLCESIILVNLHSIQAARDLATMLSSKSTRKILFSKEMKGMVDEEQDETDYWDPSNRATSSTRDSNDDNSQSDPKSPLESVMRVVGHASLDHIARSDDEQVPQVQQLRNLIAISLYFVSLDCTVSVASACPPENGTTHSLQRESAIKFESMKYARRIRRALFNDRRCMQGVLFLILADPFTQEWRGDVPTGVAGSLVYHWNEDGTELSLQPSVGTEGTTGSSSCRQERQAHGSEQSTMVAVDSAAAARSADLAQAVVEALRETEGCDHRHLLASTERDIESFVIRSLLPILSLSQITLGRCGDDMDSSCLDKYNGEDDNDDIGHAFIDDPEEADENDNDEENNDDNSEDNYREYALEDAVEAPQQGYCVAVETNTLLRHSNVIPLLCLALAESLTAVSRELEYNGISYRQDSTRLWRIVNRVTMLAKRAVDAMLWSHENRLLFSIQTPASTGGCLVIGLMVALKDLIQAQNPTVPESEFFLFRGAWEEVTTSILTVLMDLTHENPTAQEALSVTSRDVEFRGLDVLALFLCTSVEASKAVDTEECTRRVLSIFVNILHSGEKRRTLLEMPKPLRNGDEEDALFLEWMATWAVAEVSGTGNAGNSDGLATSGTAFFLFGLLLADDEDNDNDDDTWHDETPAGDEVVHAVHADISTACRIIFSRVKGDDGNAKMNFVTQAINDFADLHRKSSLGLVVGNVASRLVSRLKLSKQWRLALKDCASSRLQEEHAACQVCQMTLSDRTSVSVNECNGKGAGPSRVERALDDHASRLDNEAVKASENSSSRGRGPTIASGSLRSTGLSAAAIPSRNKITDGALSESDCSSVLVAGAIVNAESPSSISTKRTRSQNRPVQRSRGATAVATNRSSSSVAKQVHAANAPVDSASARPNKRGRCRSNGRSQEAPDDRSAALTSSRDPEDTNHEGPTTRTRRGDAAVAELSGASHNRSSSNDKQSDVGAGAVDSPRDQPTGKANDPMSGPKTRAVDQPAILGSNNSRAAITAKKASRQGLPSTSHAGKATAARQSSKNKTSDTVIRKSKSTSAKMQKNRPTTSKPSTVPRSTISPCQPVVNVDKLRSTKLPGNVVFNDTINARCQDYARAGERERAIMVEKILGEFEFRSDQTDYAPELSCVKRKITSAFGKRISNSNPLRKARRRRR